MLDGELDVAKNYRVLEWLKTELISGVANVSKAILHGTEETIADALAGLMISGYILGKRLGVTFARLEAKMDSKLRRSIVEDHEVEKWFGELSALLKHLETKKR